MYLRNYCALPDKGTKVDLFCYRCAWSREDFGWPEYIHSEVGAKEEESSVFLSGNGPLVIVLREALARDEVVRAKEKDQNLSKKVALSRVNAFIQNIHHFRDEGLKSSAAPVEHVVFLMRRSAPGIRYMRKGS